MDLKGRRRGRRPFAFNAHLAGMALPVPFGNECTSAFTALLRLEVLVRELVRHHFEQAGVRDWAKRIPGELRAKIRLEQRAEVRQAYGFKRLGPLCTI